MLKHTLTASQNSSFHLNSTEIRVKVEKNMGNETFLRNTIFYVIKYVIVMNEDKEISL